jgi:hypothetical protein
LKEQLEQALARKSGEIARILADYAVPRIPIEAAPVSDDDD